jgi:hypothetical protein
VSNWRPLWWALLPRSLAGSGQHRDARKHKLCPIHVEPSLAENILNVRWSETNSFRVVDDTAEQVPSCKRGALMGVVDHKVMNQDQSAGRERIHRALGQDANVIVSDGAPEIRHQNYIMSDRPIGGDSVSTEVRDPPSKAGLLSTSSGSVNCLREVENCRGKLRICGTECETIRTAAATDIEQPSSAAEVHMFGHEARRTKRAGYVAPS